MPGGLSSFAEQEHLAQIKTGRDDVVSACFLCPAEILGECPSFFAKSITKLGWM